MTATLGGHIVLTGWTGLWTIPAAQALCLLLSSGKSRDATMHTFFNRQKTHSPWFHERRHTIFLPPFWADLWQFSAMRWNCWVSCKNSNGMNSQKKRLHLISLSILFGESVQINKLQFGRFLGRKFWSIGTCLWPEKGLTAPQSEANISCYEGYEFAWKLKIWTSY